MRRYRVEEKQKGGTIAEAVYQGHFTNGKSVILIATTITIGLLLWVFLALKFLAEMALLAIPPNLATFFAPLQSSSF